MSNTDPIPSTKVHFLKKTYPTNNNNDDKKTPKLTFINCKVYTSSVENRRGFFVCFGIFFFLQLLHWRIKKMSFFEGMYFTPLSNHSIIEHISTLYLCSLTYHQHNILCKDTVKVSFKLQRQKIKETGL